MKPETVLTELRGSLSLRVKFQFSTRLGRDQHNSQRIRESLKEFQHLHTRAKAMSSAKSLSVRNVAGFLVPHLRLSWKPLLWILSTETRMM